MRKIIKGTCQAAGCTAPLVYAGRGRPPRWCEGHRLTVLRVRERERMRRNRAEAKAASA